MRTKTTLPADGNLEKYYFNLKCFDSLQYYLVQVEDEDEEVGRRAVCKKRILYIEHIFEKTLRNTEHRIRCQKELFTTL